MINMPALILKIGSLYNLAELQHLASHFKLKRHIQTKDDLFYLFFNKIDSTYFLGGPFHGKTSNLFLFLGKPKNDKELKELLSNLKFEDSIKNQSSTHKDWAEEPIWNWDWDWDDGFDW